MLDTDGTHIDVSGSPRRARMDPRLITPPQFMTFEDVRVALGTSVVWMAASVPTPWSTAPREEVEEQVSHDDDDDDDVETSAPRIYRVTRSTDSEPEPDRPDSDEGEDADGAGKGGYADIGGWVESTYELDDNDIVEMWDDPEPSGVY